MSRSIDRKTVSVTIANGTSLSAAFNVNGYRIAAIITASAWTTAALTFQVSLDGVTYYDYFINGTEWNISSPQLSGWYEYSPYVTASAMSAPNYVKIRSGTRSAAVNQTADRVLTVILTPAIN